MPEQSNQFDRESITPEEIERIRLERERAQQEQASEFSDEQQRIAESRGVPQAAEPQTERIQPDIPGVTREQVPLNEHGGPALTSVEDLNAVLSGLQNKLDGKEEFNPSAVTDELAKMMDLEN